MIILICWAALWIFIFMSMVRRRLASCSPPPARRLLLTASCSPPPQVFYATSIPDSLGWGTSQLDASFGLVRVSFVMTSANLALVANSNFHW